MKIDRALNEIKNHRKVLDEIESFLLQNHDKFEHEDIKHSVSTSLDSCQPSLFVWAGNNPKPVAKQFRGSCKLRGDSWEMEFPNFRITFMEAAKETETVTL